MPLDVKIPAAAWGIGSKHMIDFNFPKLLHLDRDSIAAAEQNMFVTPEWLSTYGMLSGPRVSYLI